MRQPRRKFQDLYAVFVRSASAAVSAESATAAEKQDDPQAAVVSAAVSAESVSATAAAAAKQKNDPQA